MRNRLYAPESIEEDYLAGLVGGCDTLCVG